MHKARQLQGIPRMAQVTHEAKQQLALSIKKTTYQ